MLKVIDILTEIRLHILSYCEKNLRLRCGCIIAYSARKVSLLFLMILITHMLMVESVWLQPELCDLGPYSAL
jgi:hypothetical protein